MTETGESDDISDVIVVKASLVIPLLTCGLCGGLYKEATTVKHCLHVFCRSCLYKDFATSKGLKKCPFKVCGVFVKGKGRGSSVVLLIRTVAVMV